MESAKNFNLMQALKENAIYLVLLVCAPVFGWYFESTELPALLRFMRQLKQLGQRQTVNGTPLMERPEFALRLVQMDSELTALSMMVRRVVALEMDHSPQAHVLGSLLKVRATDLQQRMGDFLVETLGDDGAPFRAGADSTASLTAGTGSA